MNRKHQQTSYYTIAIKEADLHNNSLLPNKRTINKQFMSQYQLSTLECYLPETDWSTILGGIESAFNHLRSVPRGIKPHQGKDAGLNYYIKTSLKWQIVHYFESLKSSSASINKGVCEIISNILLLPQSSGLLKKFHGKKKTKYSHFCYFVQLFAQILDISLYKNE